MYYLVFQIYCFHYAPRKFYGCTTLALKAILNHCFPIVFLLSRSSICLWSFLLFYYSILWLLLFFKLNDLFDFLLFNSQLRMVGKYWGCASLTNCWGHKLYVALALLCLFKKSYILWLTDMIEELINKGQHLDAINFAYEAGLQDKFPPIPLLKSFLKDSKKTASSISEERSSPVRSTTVRTLSLMISSWSFLNVLNHL